MYVLGTFWAQSIIYNVDSARPPCTQQAPVLQQLQLSSAIVAEELLQGAQQIYHKLPIISNFHFILLIYRARLKGGP